MNNDKETQQSDLAINATNINVVYRTSDLETQAVNNATLAVSACDYIAITGPSGCGKSSFLSILSLLEKPASGRLEIFGQSMENATEKERARCRAVTIGTVFQSFHLIPELSLYENIALKLNYQGNLSRSNIKTRVESALELVGLLHRAKHFPDQLSGGQQQRAAFARAMAGKPRLLLADEPTGNLDSTNGFQIMKLLGEINASGTAVILVTHDVNFARMAKRQVAMKDGLLLEPNEG